MDDDGRRGRERRAFIVDRLAERGAGQIAHPGGTLLAHLERVADSLRLQGTDEAVVAAGLCHAAYGTAGFPRALLSLGERQLLASWIGPEAEALVYLYCASNRRTIRDRFTGQLVEPPAAVARALLELTVANELDILTHAQGKDL